ncbi:MAG: cyclic nucleotide-binding domain-containing protein [Chloroflexaceae bacterium]|nr:cyclic nucleotide-binding domain-containing protein [Chloroflexaceae bacterium]
MTRIERLKHVDIFAELDNARIQRIAEIGVERRYQIGDIVFEEGSKSDELYIILNGEIQIQANPHSVSSTSISNTPPMPATIARLFQGQSFGEVGLVDEGIRTASARCAVSDTQLLILRRDDLMQACKEDLSLGSS